MSLRWNLRWNLRSNLRSNLRFSAFVGYRYFRARRRTTGATSTRLAVLGVAVGVMTLTAVLGVMNGFQLGFIESILEISSYHVQARLRLPAGEEGSAQGAHSAHSGQSNQLERALAELRALPAVRAAVPYRESQVLLTGPFGEQRGCLVRGLPDDTAEKDREFARRLVLEEGTLELGGLGSLVLGAELARHLGVSVGDAVDVLTLGGGAFDTLAPRSRRYQVAGLFRSGYYDFDLGWAFASLQDVQALGPGDDGSLTIGVKIANRFRDHAAAQDVRRALERAGIGDARVASWREFNRAFFAALRVEKVMMMVLIGLIFVVVGFNISQSLRRAVRERFEEIGVLKALGAADAVIRDVFVLDGLLIGVIGGGLGLLAGLLISANINAVFSAAEWLVNFILTALSVITAPFAGAAGERFTLFSSSYFYISEIPTRVLPVEAALILLFAVASPTAAAVAATRPVGRVRPAEVLRYE